MREKTKAISMLMRCSGQHTSSYRTNMCLAARPDHEREAESCDYFSGHLQELSVTCEGKVGLWMAFGRSPVAKRNSPCQIISRMTQVIPWYVVAGHHHHHHHILSYDWAIAFPKASSSECGLVLVLPLSSYNMTSFPQGHTIAAYVFFLIFPSLSFFLSSFQV